MSEQQTTFSDYDEAPAGVDTADVEHLAERIDVLESSLEKTVDTVGKIVDQIDDGADADDHPDPDPRSELAYQ